MEHAVRVRNKVQRNGKLRIKEGKREYGILDFYAGSATTAHALMQFNTEKSKHCKFILAQVPESTDENGTAYKAGYENIC